MPLITGETTIMHRDQPIDAVYHRGVQIYSSAPSASATRAWGLAGTIPPSPAKTIAGLGGTIVSGVLLVPEDTLDNNGVNHPNVDSNSAFPTLEISSVRITLAKGSGNGTRRLFLSPSANGFRLFTQGGATASMINFLNSNSVAIYITNFGELTPQSPTDYNLDGANIGLTSRVDYVTNSTAYYVASQAYGYMGTPRTLAEWQSSVDSDPNWSRTNGEISGQNRRIEVITNQAGQITRILYSGIGV